MILLIIPAVLILLFVLLFVLERKKIEIDRELEFNNKMEALSLSAINSHIINLVDSMRVQGYEYWGDWMVRRCFMRYFSSLLYNKSYELKDPSDTSIKYYTFLSEGLSGSIDNVSTTYLPMLIKLRKEVASKRFMTDEDLSEYKDREKKLIKLIEDEINKNFESVRVMKHSKNQSTLSEADYIIENGGIR